MLCLSKLLYDEAFACVNICNSPETNKQVILQHKQTEKQLNRKGKLSTQIKLYVKRIFFYQNKYIHTHTYIYKLISWFIWLYCWQNVRTNIDFKTIKTLSFCKQVILRTITIKTVLYWICIYITIYWLNQLIRFMCIYIYIYRYIYIHKYVHKISLFFSILYI